MFDVWTINSNLARSSKKQKKIIAIPPGFLFAVSLNAMRNISAHLKYKATLEDDGSPLMFEF